ncbi:hypothetical protein CYMTET_19245 [Cymbomonas tetramitiformis]|uniref:Uncharacterized protein n=1 Tax=Cymbomonas tetramitiformis TaxID=36881 RepID=A0AAE0L5D6_9CHLO|nr:hypothetical protein CYMTET_19245 [Cymbomonas tetramitiformis]
MDHGQQADKVKISDLAFLAKDMTKENDDINYPGIIRALARRFTNPPALRDHQTFKDPIFVNINGDEFIKVDAIHTTSTCPVPGGYDLLTPGANGVPLVRFLGIEHEGKLYPHGVDMVLIRISDGVRCFYDGDEYGYATDYKSGLGFELHRNVQVVEWDSVEGHGKIFFNQEEYEEEQSFRPSALKFICTREIARRAASDLALAASDAAR